MDARVTGNLGEILLREALITREQLEKAERERHETGKSLARTLVEMGVISEKVKLGILQKKLGVDIVGLRNFRLDPQLATRIPKSLAVRHLALPIRSEPDGLLVAMDDPSDLEAVDKLSAVAGMKIRTVLAASKEIDQLLEGYPEEKPEEVVEVEKPPTTLRFIRGLTFWVLLLGPLLLFGAMLKWNAHFALWLSKQKLTEFDFALYLLLLWGTWSVVIYYIHDVFFSYLMGEEAEEAPKAEDEAP